MRLRSLVFVGGDTVVFRVGVLVFFFYVVFAVFLVSFFYLKLFLRVGWSSYRFV